MDSEIKAGDKVIVKREPNQVYTVQARHKDLILVKESNKLFFVKELKLTKIETLNKEIAEWLK
jgi:hypothetical protein